MRIDTRPVNDGVVRLAVSGEIDLDTADTLAEAITGVLATASPAELVVDLAEVTLCDSAGIEVLLRGRDAAAAQAVRLVVINPRGIVRRALDVTGTLDRLTAVPALL